MTSISTLESRDSPLKSTAAPNYRKPTSSLDLVYLVSNGSLPSYSAGASVGSGTISLSGTSRNELFDNESQGGRPRPLEFVVIRDEVSAGSSLGTLSGRDNPSFTPEKTTASSQKQKSSKLTVTEHGYFFERWNWPAIRCGCSILVIATVVALISASIAFIIIYSKACYPKFKWWHGASIYSVDPHLFSDSNSDNTGDLIGLTARLEYLVTLGTTVVQLDNILKSYKNQNGKYHVLDYGDLNEDIGTLKTFKSFCDAAHDSDIKVILNVPLAQTSDEHDWFRQSRQAGTGDYRDFYIWSNKKPPDTNSSFDAVGNQYYVHFDTPGQPALNWNKKEVEAAILKQLLAVWSRGADGVFLSDLHMIQATKKTEKVIEIIKSFRTFIDGKTAQDEEGRQTSLMVPSQVIELIRSSNTDVEVSISNIDLIDTVVQISPNTTYSLKDFVSSNVIQGHQEPYPWPCWRLTDMEKHKEILVGTLIQIISLPGSVAVQSGFEIGDPDLVKTGVLSWMQTSRKTLLPFTTTSGGPKEAEKNMKYIETIINVRQDSLGLRFNGMMYDDEFKKGYNFVVVNNTLILHRVHPRAPNYYVIMNYGKAFTNSDYSTFLSSAEIVLDMSNTLPVSGLVDWDKVSLKMGEVIVAKQSKWTV